MERHRCKQCYRRFANGRALAGHMRSHVASASVRRPLPSPCASSSSHPAPKAAQEEEKELAHPPPAFSSSSAFHQDGESDAESSLNRRPKRSRRAPVAEFPVADEPLSSVSDASSEEDVARCLMLLSRDAWSKSEAEERQSDGHDAVEGEDYKVDAIGSGSRRRRSRFRCGTCWKVFRSYQALGGHRASHKRVGVECVPITARTPIHGDYSSAANPEKVWECPYCHRIFSSGQALGGHKRSHLSASATASPAIPLPRVRSPSTATATAAVNNNNNTSGIDLNLPAPLEEEVELSALSVATDLARK
ncbi:hypothetical protein Cni_G26246 [Canna indica]|uniref:C2H2-type domain-containing protein n=1 Tax=Canna indica TaxID=4628 RepID=A0AAQ3KZA8_9LILI|nr:hypothetical protein Cni_G26246 [Canna indica]